MNPAKSKTGDWARHATKNSCHGRPCNGRGQMYGSPRFPNQLGIYRKRHRWRQIVTILFVAVLYLAVMTTGIVSALVLLGAYAGVL